MNGKFLLMGGTRFRRGKNGGKYLAVNKRRERIISRRYLFIREDGIYPLVRTKSFQAVKQNKQLCKGTKRIRNISQNIFRG